MSMRLKSRARFISLFAMLLLLGALKGVAAGDPDLADLEEGGEAAKAEPFLPSFGKNDYETNNKKVDELFEPDAQPKGESKGAAPAVSANRITNLEFKQDEKGSQIVVSSHHKLKFSEQKSAGARQFVYLFENTETPEKFQRAYDTTEFVTPVALFTLFQVPGAATNTSKLIVQLREDQSPKLVDSDRGLILEFAGSQTVGDPRVVDTTKRELLSGDNIYAKGGAYSGEVIQRLEIKNSDIQDVLRLIARSSGYNIVIGDDVQGKIGTLSLTNIPWDQAFTLVLQSKKLGFVREGNVLRVGTTAALRTEKEEAAAVEQAAEKVEPLKTILLPISYAKAADLAPRAKSFLTPRGAIETDTRTNTIIIKDVEKVVSRVQKLLQSLDTQPPRVSIAAKIVEMQSSLTRNLGLRTLTASSNIDGTNNGNNTAGASFSASNGGGSFAATIRAVDFLNLSSAFQLAELDSKSRLLASPSVSVVANQTGTVTQSLAFFVPNTTIVAGAVQPGFSQVTTTLNLAVTPIVSGDGSIFMNVSVNNDIPNGTGGSTQIASRSITTQVLVENGDTAVIGGVFQGTVATSRDGIPLLGRIPLLGYLFASTQIRDTSSEIFIFLTAKIMNAEESFKRTL
jgi:type IV pilus assembly protein PilQ